MMKLQCESGSLLDLAVKEMNRRYAVYAATYLPFYMCSTVLHLLNVLNQDKPFYYDESGPYNFRMHTLHLAPTGGGKTYYVKNLGRSANALFRDTQVPITYKGSMTAAAFTGTIASGSEGKGIEIEGIAKKNSKSIIMIEEFHSTLKSMEGQHGDDLENQFLTALDSGYVFRDLARGEIAFQTHCTIQAASQFTRVKTSSGMLRRFMITAFKPTIEDIGKLRASRRMRRHLVYDETGTIMFRKAFNDFCDDLSHIERIAFDFDVIDNMFDKYKVQHYDEEIYERFLIGMNLITKRDITDTPFITCTPDMEEFIKSAIKWRNEALMGSELSLALSTIKDWCEANPGTGMPTKLYRISMIHFGLSFEESSAILSKLKNYKIVGIHNYKIKVRE